MEIMNHEVFGDIMKVNDSIWVKGMKIYFLGKERLAVLKICEDYFAKGGFSECEILAYKNFIENLDVLLRKAETEVYKYYKDVCEDYRDEISDKEHIDEIAPIINSKEELKDLVSEMDIYFYNSRDYSIRIVGICMECTWEEYHGLGIRFENEEVAAVGFSSLVN